MKFRVNKGAGLRRRYFRLQKSISAFQGKVITVLRGCEKIVASTAQFRIGFDNSQDRPKIAKVLWSNAG